MYLPTTRILQLLCIASLTPGAVGCDKDGPGNCQFVDLAHEFTLCNWTHGGTFELMNRTFGGYIQLVRGSDTGTLTSKTTCSTGGQTHCFRFAYGVDVDNTLTLSVSIKYGLNESLLWVLSSGGGWNEASVPITTNHNFNVMFKAERHCGQNTNQDSVRIDAIRYEKLTTNINCSFQPPAASPTSLSAIPSSCNSTIPSPTRKTTTSHETVPATTISHEAVTATSISHEAVTATAISHETVTATTILLETVPATAISHETVTATATSHETMTATAISHETVTATTVSHETVTETTVTAPFYTSSSTGGNQQIRTSANPTTTTTTNETVTDTTLTPHSNTTTSDGGDQQTRTTMTNTRSSPPRSDEDEPVEPSNDIGIIAGVVVGVIVIIVIVVLLLILLRRKRRHSWEAYSPQENPDSRHANESPPTQQSDSCNIIRNPEVPTTSTESAMPIYAVVNKSRKTRQETPQLNPYEICDQSSELRWQNAESETARKQCQDGDGITSTPRQPDQLMAGTDSVYQVPRGDPTVNSEDQGEEYNALDFGGNRRVADLDHAEGKPEGGAGDVYSHLNDGEGGTYSEVDRQKRPEVAGDEYSHIW